MGEHKFAPATALETGAIVFDAQRELATLRETIDNLLKISGVHAEGMKHMGDALIGFDRRLRDLEKNALRKA